MLDKIWKENEEYLSQYTNVTEEVKGKILKYTKRFNMSGIICAWYWDWEDFCSDWCDDCGYTRTEARSLLHGGHGEFQIIEGFGIVRYAE